MAQLFESEITTGPLAGYTLIRMPRPANWDTEWCQIEECDNLHPTRGYRRRAPSVWSVQKKGEGFIGWRTACSRKHALEIWESELREA